MINQVSQIVITAVVAELWEVLHELSKSPEYAHLTTVDKAGGLIADAIAKLSNNKIN